MGEWLYGSNRHARQRSPPPPRPPAGRCFHRARTTTPPTAAWPRRRPSRSTGPLSGQRAEQTAVMHIGRTSSRLPSGRVRTCHDPDRPSTTPVTT